MFINDHVYISERDGDTDTEKGCQNLLYSRRLLMIVTLSPFPGGPGLAGTRMSPFWILLELRVMVVLGLIFRRALNPKFVAPPVLLRFDDIFILYDP